MGGLTGVIAGGGAEVPDAAAGHSVGTGRQALESGRPGHTALGGGQVRAGSRQVEQGAVARHAGSLAGVDGTLHG